MIRRPPRSTLFPLHDALPIYLPSMLGVDPKALDRSIRPLLPGYMTMGHAGMAEMGAMDMPIPPNSLPMKGAHGPFGYTEDRKSTRLNSSHANISYAVFCLKKK